MAALLRTLANALSRIAPRHAEEESATSRRPRRTVVDGGSSSYLIQNEGNTRRVLIPSDDISSSAPDTRDSLESSFSDDGVPPSQFADVNFPVRIALMLQRQYEG